MTTRKTGPYKATSLHPDCPPGKPHATVHTPTGEVIKCHTNLKNAQDLALTLNIPDATTPDGGPAIIPAAAPTSMKGGDAEMTTDSGDINAANVDPAERMRIYWTTGEGGVSKVRWGLPAPQGIGSAVLITSESS